MSASSFSSTLFEPLFTKHGLVFVGVVKPNYPLAFRYFETWLSEKRHANMSYLERHLELRKDPQKLLINSHGDISAILYLLPYFQGERLSELKNQEERSPRVASYARFSDYHHRYSRCSYR